jgi:hypothetical protein
MGQVQTAEGRPVAGAHVVLNCVCANDRDDLGPWLAAVDKKEEIHLGNDHLPRYLIGPGLARIRATTDAKGRFRLPGIGQGRVAEVKVFGASAAIATVWARTARGNKLLVTGTMMTGDGCYGNEMVVVVTSSRPVVGVVTDADTGAALVGAQVQIVRFARTNQFMSMVTSMEVRTDAKGRFRVEGLPLGADNLLLVRPRLDQPYLPATVEADTSAGDGPAKVKVETRRGVWVQGRVTDAETNRPLVAKIDVFCPEKNPNRAKYPNYGWILPGTLYRTDGAGNFRVPAIPGPAVIAAQLEGTGGPNYGAETTSQAGRMYRQLRGVQKIDGLPAENFGARYFLVRPWTLETEKYHQLRSLEITADKGPVQCDFKIK